MATIFPSQKSTIEMYKWLHEQGVISEYRLRQELTMPPSTDNQPTYYSISEQNIRQWWDNQHTQIVTPALDKRHDREKFVAWVSQMLDEMHKLRNE